MRKKQMNERGLKCIAWMLALGLLFSLMFAFVPISHAETSDSANPSHNVVVIPLIGNVDSVMKSFMLRALEEAEALNPAAIIIEMDTPGGRVDIAQDLSQRIIGSPAHTVVLVRGKAASAGSFLAMSANEIAMTPGSAIGSAALVDGAHNYVDDPKLVALWISEMESVAGKNGRNQNIARAMADLQAKIELPELGRTKNPGEILSLSVAEAKKAGYAEYEAGSVQDLISQMKLADSHIERIDQTTAERIAAYLVHPVVATLLLFLGIAGVAIELFVPGFGIPGILGILGFGLYFFGHYISGLAGVETIVLFIVGLVLLALELFIPSFGILGILGSISMISGVVRAAYDTSNALLSLGIAFVAALIVIIIVVRVFKHRGIWNRFILKDALTTEEGYVSNSNQTEILGKIGRALTPLRPAGTVLIDDHKFDVVTDGSFVGSDELVEVIQVEGSRIVVRPHNGN
ncbi:ATP-dependent Clp protease proteolytic subunit [Paenibacillus profundus]|uniref:ATP-dependent Clp protease proteolytic subunit n=1 Tax=Paenibacillus profundus TaxID=1173085 RepID=A0ABS8Y807_9BACL|nr:MULTISPECIES: NfeD family protein [Paenibacillus]MCE5167780.1 ATP-dependent Clp protease proteolytic subunit [Paenibacillus profundus]